MHNTVAILNIVVYPYISNIFGPIRKPNNKPKLINASSQAKCHPRSLLSVMSVI